MAEVKTVENDGDVTQYVNNIEDLKRRLDCQKLLSIFKDATGENPKMWGDSMVGYGEYHYKYKSGHEGDYFLTGFSSRKQNLTIYIMTGFAEFNHILQLMGKFKTSSSCLYIKKLDDVDTNLLKEMIAVSAQKMKENYSG
ncbi:hypothetical protein BH23BAC2_BH23BAC2_12600 [soil metagenome]